MGGVQRGGVHTGEESTQGRSTVRGGAHTPVPNLYVSKRGRFLMVSSASSLQLSFLGFVLLVLVGPTIIALLARVASHFCLLR